MGFQGNFRPAGSFFYPVKTPGFDVAFKECNLISNTVKTHDVLCTSCMPFLENQVGCVAAEERFGGPKERQSFIQLSKIGVVKCIDATNVCTILRVVTQYDIL